MSNRPYSEAEIAVLLPFVARKIPSRAAVLALLPDRNRDSLNHKITSMRRQAGTVWRIV